jgi:hypothetical protein
MPPRSIGACPKCSSRSPSWPASPCSFCSSNLCLTVYNGWEGLKCWPTNINCALRSPCFVEHTGGVFLTRIARMKQMTRIYSFFLRNSPNSCHSL